MGRDGMFDLYLLRSQIMQWIFGRCMGTCVNKEGVR